MAVLCGFLSADERGRWLSESEFLLDLDTVSNVNHLIFNIHMYGATARVRMNETTGEMRDVEVAAVLVRTPK